MCLDVLSACMFAHMCAWWLRRSEEGVGAQTLELQWLWATVWTWSWIQVPLHEQWVLSTTGASLPPCFSFVHVNCIGSSAKFVFKRIFKKKLCVCMHVYIRTKCNGDLVLKRWANLQDYFYKEKLKKREGNTQNRCPDWKGEWLSIILEESISKPRRNTYF